MVQGTPPQVGAMPPKAKPKAKALAKGAAKARARGIAMAAPRRRRPAGALGGLRRPAAQIEREGPLSGSEGWRAGQEVVGVEVHPSEWREGDLFVCKEATYYLRECQIAGKIAQVELRAGEVYLVITLQGTTNEALLKLHSGQPDLKYQLHLCQGGCNQQEVADHVIHTRKIRKVQDSEKEEGWICNLQKVAPLDEGDDLQHLRARQREEGGPLGIGGGAPGTPKEVAKKKKKKKDSKKKKTKKKEEKSQEAETSSTGEEVKMDGSNARMAAKKDMSSLFRGTGLDPPGAGAPQGGQAGPEEHQEAGIQEQLLEELEQLIQHGGQSGQCRGGDGLRTGVKSATDRSGVSRDPGKSSAEADASGAFLGTGFPGPTGAIEALRPCLLQAAGEPEVPVGACPTRDVEHCHLHRPPDGRQCGRGPGYHGTEIQVVRIDSEWMPLDGGPETRGGATGECHVDTTPGDAFGATGRVRGEQASMAGGPAGWTQQQLYGQELGQDQERRERRRQRRRQESEVDQGRPEGRWRQEEGGGAKSRKLADVASNSGVTSGVVAPGTEFMSGSHHQDEDGYERGKEMAPPQQNGTGTPVRGARHGAVALGEPWQSVHVVPPKWEGMNSFEKVIEENDLIDGAVDPALKTMAGTFAAASAKNDARAILPGKRLGQCGDFLSKWLLEVLPLRSQSKGKDSARGVYPLPYRRG